MKLVLLILLTSLNLFGQTTPLIYPKAVASNQVDTIWGQPINDPYRWMEKINSTETNEWLTAEQKLTDNYNQKTFSSMKDYLTKYSHIYYKPFNKQGKYYFTFMVDDISKTASLYYQQYINSDAILLFNPNYLDKKATISIDGITLSSNNKTLALMLSKNGSDWKTIRFLDMKTQKLLNDTISFVKYSNIYWYNQGIFYVKYNVKDEKESFEGTIKGRALYYHKLGTSQREDILVYKPHNSYKFFDFEVTPEEKYLILYYDTTINKKITQRVSQVKLNDSLAFNFKVFISVLADKQINFNVLGLLNEKLIVQSTMNAATGAIFSYDPNARNKKEVLVMPYVNQLEFSKMVGNKLLTVYSDDTSSYACVRDSTGKIVSTLTTPAGYRFNFNSFSHSTADNIMICTFHSFFAPPTVYKYDLNTYKS